MRIEGRLNTQLRRYAVLSLNTRRSVSSVSPCPAACVTHPFVPPVRGASGGGAVRTGSVDHTDSPHSGLGVWNAREQSWMLLCAIDHLPPAAARAASSVTTAR